MTPGSTRSTRSGRHPGDGGTPVASSDPSVPVRGQPRLTWTSPPPAARPRPKPRRNGPRRRNRATSPRRPGRRGAGVAIPRFPIPRPSSAAVRRGRRGHALIGRRGADPGEPPRQRHVPAAQAADRLRPGVAGARRAGPGRMIEMEPGRARAGAGLTPAAAATVQPLPDRSPSPPPSNPQISRVPPTARLRAAAGRLRKVLVRSAVG